MDKKKMKSIRGLILFTAVVILAIMYSKDLLGVLSLCVVILKPFIYGGAIAFVLNIPLCGIEKLLFSRAKGKVAAKLKRPVSIVLTFIVVIWLIMFVVETVVPQLAKTIVDLGNKIPKFIDDVIIWLEQQYAAYPQIVSQIQELDNKQFNWNTIIDSVISFLKNGFGNMLSSTFSVASSIIGGVVNIVVALIFSIYVLIQKEKLGNQADRVLLAYCPEKIYQKAKYIFSLLYRNFTKFISGQCLEAVILGCMFIIVMSIFRFPYALLIGVLIGFMALIPIVGAFVGCAVGTFLIFMDDPMKALWFLVLFLLLQQIEGNLIYPHVVGNSVGLPSIWVLVAVSVGGSLMGILGMLLFIPLTSTGYTLVRENVNMRNAEKELKKTVAEKEPEDEPEKNRK